MDKEALEGGHRGLARAGGVWPPEECSHQWFLRPLLPSDPTILGGTGDPGKDTEKRQQRGRRGMEGIGLPNSGKCFSVKGAGNCVKHC